MTAWPALETRLNARALQVFGESVVVDGQAHQAEFHEPHEAIDMGEFSAVAAVPRIVMQSHLVPPAPVGKPVSVRFRNYRVADARPDGRGLTVLQLELA